MSGWTRFRRFVLPSLTLAIFLVSLIHSFLKTETVEEGLGSQVTRSIWLASKVEIDYLRLLANLERYGLDEAGIRHEDVTAGFVRLRGRLIALLEGEDAGLLRRSFEDEIDADLIVMGTRGHTGLKHVLLGSVAERTIRLAPCSVLTVKEEEKS